MNATADISPGGEMTDPTEARLAQLREIIAHPPGPAEFREATMEYDRLTGKTPAAKAKGKTPRFGKARAPSRKAGPVALHAVGRRIDGVAAAPIRWLWPGRIACGKLTLLAGDPGLGKSQVTASLAAIVSRGGRWPVDGRRCEPGSVVFLSIEDAVADTIRPRLEAAGADLSRCYILDAIEGAGEDGSPVRRPFNLQTDMDRLHAYLAEIGDVRLVIIDPISAYLGSADSHKNSEVRAMLGPMGDVAEASDVAIVGVTHLNKSNAQEALQRISGSLAFVAAARAALIVLKDRDNAERRLMLPLKNNLAKDTGGLAFSIRSAVVGQGIETSCVEWEAEPCLLAVDEAMRIENPEKSGELQEAIQFIADLLADGPMAAKEAERMCQEEGFSLITVRRAKKKLEVNSVKTSAKGAWLWEISKAIMRENTSPCKNHDHHDRLEQPRGLQTENAAKFFEGDHCDVNETSIFVHAGPPVEIL